MGYNSRAWPGGRERREHPVPQGQQVDLPGGEARSGPGHQGLFWGRDESLGPGPPEVPFVPAGAWMRPGIQRDWPRWGSRQLWRDNWRGRFRPPSSAKTQITQRADLWVVALGWRHL